MNLKQSFRAQNKLKDVIDNLYGYLAYPTNYLTVTMTHKKSKVVQTKDDEILVAEKRYDFPTDDIINTLLFLLKEKEILTAKICQAKSKVELDIDGTISMNVLKRSVLGSLRNLCKAKATTKITQGRDYTFNVEGNQVSYVYDIEQESKPEFDQDALRIEVKKLEAEVDELSTKIDEIYIATEVDYTPAINENDSVEDIIELITAKLKAAN